jgi:hypothetical protein
MKTDTTKATAEAAEGTLFLGDDRFDPLAVEGVKAAWEASASTIKDLGCFAGVYIIRRSNDPIEFPVS